MNAAFLKISSDHCRSEYSQSQFFKLLKANCLNCENCSHFWPSRDKKEKRGYCPTTSGLIKRDFFCKNFNPKSNG